MNQLINFKKWLIVEYMQELVHTCTWFMHIMKDAGVRTREWVTASLRIIAYDTPFNLARTFASYITSDFS